MRRAAPTAGLSPQLIKHFAIATVSVTALLALFATDADWGAQAQLDEVEAKNRLAAAETEKLGAKKITAKLKIRRSSSVGPTGDIGVDNPSGGGGSLNPDEPVSRRGDYADPARANRPANAVAQAHDRIAAPPGLAPPPHSNPKGAPPQSQQRKPTQEQLEAMLEASRQRSGASGSGD